MPMIAIIMLSALCGLLVVGMAKKKGGGADSSLCHLQPYLSSCLQSSEVYGWCGLSKRNRNEKGENRDR